MFIPCSYLFSKKFSPTYEQVFPPFWASYEQSMFFLNF